jgi:DNA-binding CsgD family transcriptional regulator
MAKQNAAEEDDAKVKGLSAFETQMLNLLALLLVQKLKQAEQIALLNRAGFRPVQIAALLGTTRNTVNVELSNQRRAKRPKGRPKGKK